MEKKDHKKKTEDKRPKPSKNKGSLTQWRGYHKMPKSVTISTGKEEKKKE